MTSDAKIGLLLGLVFIFIIAFIINGLPSFRNDTNDLTTNGIVTLQNGPPENTIKEPQTGRFNQPGPIIERRSGDDAFVMGQDNDIRSRIPMSEILGGNQETFFAIDTSGLSEKMPLRGTSDVKKSPLIRAEEKRIVPIFPDKNVEYKSTTPKSEPFIKLVAPKSYVVLKGDNLATIAKRFYGAEEGNKRANITRIFNANSKQLKSPDEIFVGQKLIIPPLSASTRSRATGSGPLSASIFERVRSIGRRGITSIGGKGANTKKYVVKEGDSLWKIAADQFGKGSRYTEISKLNADVLGSEYSLRIGTVLRLPAQ